DEFADRQMIDLLRETGKRSEALSIVRKLLEIRPNDEMLARLEATILIEIGKSDEAVNLYKKRVGINNATSSIKETGVKTATDLFSSLVFLSQLYQQAAKSLEAIETAKQAIKIAQSPERIQLGLLELASAQQSAGRFPDAENTLREILKKSPNNPIALNNLGYFLLERGERFDEALSLIQKAVESDPTNPSYLDSLGWAYFKLGRLNEAEEYLKRAIGFDPTSPTINEHLGDVMEKLGKIELARDHWQRAAELTSDTKDLARIRSKLR
ncbi:MAG TPA: tetratricopeptide repeat protein, partial [Pyrinomonadaceae bacterium]|nr:tetratricopeptide repeat protein [Pyrinomonadaceae bacterium]